MESKTSKAVLPLAILGGSVAGALAAFFLMKRELNRLGLRTAPAKRAVAPAATPVPVEPPVEEEVSSETIAIVSAVVAAFLGKSARVRSVRRIGPGVSSWVQQGRVSVQGSHYLGRS